MKVCSRSDCKRAGLLLDAVEFYADKDAKSGLKSHCIQCCHIESQKRRDNRNILNLCKTSGCKNVRLGAGATCEWHNIKRRTARANNAQHYRQKGKEFHIRLKYAAFNAYGGAKCACCDETSIEFLTIDHINGHGNDHRRQIGGSGYKTYQWLKKNAYPSGFRVLCFNCNSARGAFGYCPHERQSPKCAVTL
jgi:hypothetical protein